MPPKPKMIMDEEVEEVTRRIAPGTIMPSLRPLPTMPVGLSSSSPTFSTSVTKPKILTKQRQVSDVKSTHFTWKLSHVPVLPEFHPLERTATFVPNATPAEVASRISSILRERSIEATYDNGKAKVKCTTTEGVDFRIRLYRGRGRYNHGIIVEVQRRFGTSFVFHQDTQAILDGARGEVVPPKPLLKSGNHLPSVSNDDDNEDSEDSYSVPNGESSLMMISKIMKLNGYDSQHLGLQMLSPLVDSERLSSSTARAVASRLFEPDCEVGRKVFDYIVTKNTKTKSRVRKRGLFDEDEDDCDSSRILRNMSLGILANATKVCGTVPQAVREALRPVLLHDLHDAGKQPNTAFLAARCLEGFIQEDHDQKELGNAFQVAHEVGKAQHANLMHQTKLCMEMVDATFR